MPRLFRARASIAHTQLGDVTGNVTSLHCAICALLSVLMFEQVQDLHPLLFQ